MMQALLAKRLVEKGAIRQHTEFEAHYNVHGLSCLDDAQTVAQFRVIAARVCWDRAEVVFEAELCSDYSVVYRFTNAHILSVDGMSPARLAATYHLSPTGEDVAIPKKPTGRPYGPRQDMNRRRKGRGGR